jgi:hypothetical protein
MQRRIVGFHQDEDGDWVAELSCLHNLHVRHQPPFQERSWVLEESGRAARIGAELNCPLDGPVLLSVEFLIGVP